MKLSGILAGTALVLASPFSLAAGGSIDLSSGSAGFSSTPLSGGFTDVYSFTLAEAGTITGSITSVVSGLQDIDFSGVFLTGPSGVFTFSQLLGDPFETWTLAATLVEAGSYTLAVIGTNSPDGASYGGNLAVSLVPEPEPYAMLLAGAAVIGLLARRRAGLA